MFRADCAVLSVVFKFVEKCQRALKPQFLGETPGNGLLHGFANARMEQQVFDQ